MNVCTASCGEQQVLVAEMPGGAAYSLALPDQAYGSRLVRPGMPMLYDRTSGWLLGTAPLVPLTECDVGFSFW